MKPELQQIFDSTPEDQPRSKLEPFRDLILRWRRQGRSYRRILHLIKDKCGLEVSYGTLHEFVQRRSRPRNYQPEPEPEQPAWQSNLEPSPAPMRTPKKLTPEDAARQRAILQALRNKPVVSPEPAKKFVYDPDEPLVIDRTIKD